MTVSGVLKCLHSYASLDMYAFSSLTPPGYTSSVQLITQTDQSYMPASGFVPKVDMGRRADLCWPMLIPERNLMSWFFPVKQTDVLDTNHQV